MTFPLDSTINVVAIDAAQTDYILVQTSKETLDDDNYNALDFLEFELLDMVSERTYLCRFKGKDLDQLRDLDFVTFVDTYKEDFVVAASLKEEASTPRPLLVSSGQAPDVSTGQAMVQVDVVLHSGSAADGGTIKREIARMTGVEPSTITIIDERLRAGLPYSSLMKIAQLDPVQAILPVHQVKVMHDIRREVFPSSPSQPMSLLV
ncbi:hypothetical protein QFC21_005278 [Naganishia friedmannii]|uniref:Uncharacterized protein n=1 Tax=Naganishia friedmannii TaxID=89922 RepID=A0ACC2VBK1_9TREE|nr:hypothetical protein QFC21_005278 [Naganishia friedmannii]